MRTHLFHGNLFKNSGSITVETALALPVFVIALYILMYSIKAFFVMTNVEFAIKRAATDLASYSYILAKTGLVNGKENNSVVIGFISFLNGEKFSTDELISLPDSPTRSDSIDSHPDEQGKNSGDLKYPDSILNYGLKSLLNLLSGEIKKAALIPLVESYMNIYIDKWNKDMLEDNFDFKKSKFYYGSNNLIIINVSYHIKIPFIENFIKGIKVEQQAVARAWMTGDSEFFQDGIENIEASNIWDIKNNLDRGRYVRSLFGANLPFNFPVIAAFSNGTATMIKSMDITSLSYQDTFLLQKKIYGYIDELSGFKGGKALKTKISEGEIVLRRLLLIIPANKLNSGIEAVLNKSGGYAGSVGVKLEIKRFQHKKTEEDYQETFP